MANISEEDMSPVKSKTTIFQKCKVALQGNGKKDAWLRDMTWLPSLTFSLPLSLPLSQSPVCCLDISKFFDIHFIFLIKQ